jgi:hypothetical protein
MYTLKFSHNSKDKPAILKTLFSLDDLEYITYPTPPEFVKKFSKYINSKFPWNVGICIAGGSVNLALDTKIRPNPIITNNSDIDIFIYDNYEENITNIINYLVEEFGNIKFMPSFNLVNFLAGGKVFQIIKLDSAYKDIYHIINDFDCGYTKCAWDGSNIYLTRECYTAISTSLTTCNKTSLDYNYHLRIFKAIIRGYTLENMPSIAEIMSNSSVLEYIQCGKKQPSIVLTKNDITHIVATLVCNRDIQNFTREYTPIKTHTQIVLPNSSFDKQLHTTYPIYFKDKSNQIKYYYSKYRLRLPIKNVVDSVYFKSNNATRVRLQLEPDVENWLVSFLGEIILNNSKMLTKKIPILNIVENSLYAVDQKTGIPIKDCILVKYYGKPDDILITGTQFKSKYYVHDQLYLDFKIGLMPIIYRTSATLYICA